MLWPEKKHITLPKIILEGPSVFLRPPRMEDWPLWVEARWRNYHHIKPFEPAWPKRCLTQDFFRRRLLRQHNDWKDGRGNYFLLFRKEDEALIGGININNICRGAAHYASPGYWIDQRHQGQGYMSEGMLLVIEYCFEELKLHRINAACVLHNERSKKLLMRAGFAEEGQAEKYLKIDGTWQDHILFGLTKESWEAMLEKEG